MRDRSERESGLILTECKKLLRQLRITYAGDPAGEYHHLALLALEREQLVSYAYRQDVLGQRIKQLIVPAEVVDVLQHAFTQVWRDEEAHTVLTRGILVDRERRPVGLAKTTVEQTAGYLAGWSASLKHHVPRSAAPLRNVFVDGLAQAARLVGKLSPELRAELRPKSFRDFCLYNVDAEETAELCWRRLVELERELGGEDVATFERIAQEEREHRDVFEIVAAALDRYDWLVDGVDAEILAKSLAAIAPRFSPGSSDLGPLPFGTGSPVHVLDDGSFTHHEAITDALNLLGPMAGKSVVVKASWMMGYAQRDPSSVVDPDALHFVVDELTKRGAHPTVVDGPNLYSGLFAGRSVEAVAHHFGIKPNCPIVDSVAETVEITDSPMLGPHAISKVWVEADVRISMVRLRSHPREHVHGSTANLEGLILGSNDNVFWQRRYDHSVAALSAAMVAPPHLAVIDAWESCPDGLFGIMAGRHVVHPGRLYASTDALACDLVALRHTGSARSVTSATLRRAIELFGDPRSHIDIVGHDEDIDGWRNPYDNVFSGFLADLSYPVFAYLSQSGALFAPPMDEAFPEIEPLAAPLRTVRSILQRLLGLRPPSS